MSEALPPPLPTEVADPGRVRRVGALLIAFGFVEIGLNVVYLVAALSGYTLGQEMSFTISFGFAVYWIAAWLVFNQKRAIWPLMAYISALALGGLLGSTLGLGLGLPNKLILAIGRHSPFWLWFPLTCGVAYGGFFLWILLESLATRDRWPAGFQNRTNPWLQPRRFLGYGLVPSAVLTWLILALLQGAWGYVAADRAREKNGPQYDYFPINYQFRSINGQSSRHATVLAYSDAEIKIVSLTWSD
jgi:hypothetical protein